MQFYLIKNDLYIKIVKTKIKLSRWSLEIDSNIYLCDQQYTAHNVQQ